MEGSPSGCKLEATNHNAPTVKKHRAGDEADAVGNRWPHRHGESQSSVAKEKGGQRVMNDYPQRASFLFSPGP